MGRETQFLPHPDSFCTAHDHKNSSGWDLSAISPLHLTAPTWKQGGRAQAAFGKSFVHEIVTQSLGLREKRALLGM